MRQNDVNLERKGKSKIHRLLQLVSTIRRNQRPIRFREENRPTSEWQIALLFIASGSIHSGRSRAFGRRFEVRAVDDPKSRTRARRVV